MNRFKNADVLDTDGSIGLDPAPRMVGRDQAVPKVVLPRTPPKSHELSKTHRSHKQPVFDNIILLFERSGHWHPSNPVLFPRIAPGKVGARTRSGYSPESLWVTS
jgi:hypothetical protein